MTGFGTTPDELHNTANVIDDAVQKTAGLVWQGPSGNYGHPGVQEGWGQFIDDAKSEIQKLANTTKGHGESLVQCAQHYLAVDEQVAGMLGNAAGEVGSAIGGAAASAGRAVGSAVSGAVSSGVHAVGDAAGAVGSAVGHAVAGGVRLSGDIMGGFGGAAGSGIAKEAQL